MRASQRFVAMHDIIGFFIVEGPNVFLKHFYFIFLSFTYFEVIKIIINVKIMFIIFLIDKNCFNQNTLILILIKIFFL